MKTVTIRDFRSRPKQLRKTLAREDEAVLTVNGRPVAVLLPTDASRIDETLETVRRARGLGALRALRRHSQASGASRLSSREIGAIVAAARRNRRRRG